MKFICRTVWIIFLATIVCLLMLKYFLPTIITDYSNKTATNIEKKINSKINTIKEKPSSKKIIKELKRLKDKMSE